MTHWLQIAAGGALGAVLRYATVTGLGRITGGAFPWGTLTANALGSLLMGLVAGLVITRVDVRAAAPFLMTGLLGGYTTFSAFSLDTVRLWERGEFAAALGYVGLSLLLSLGGLVAGLALVRG
ncbi:MAG: CrcB family protein [Pseudomonadota bacterium]